MRTKYIQGQDGKLREVRSRGVGSDLHFISSDVEPFISPVDGTLISSKRTLREHNIRNDVIQTEEWGNETEHIQAQQHDERFGKAAKKQRLRDIIGAVDKHRGNEFKTFQQYQDHLDRSGQ